MKTIKLTLILIIFIISCKPKPHEPEYCLMTQEFKDYTVFAEGDYWVYKSNTDEKDSIVLINQRITQNEEENIIFNNFNQIFIKNSLDTFRIFTSFFGNDCKYILQNDNEILYFFPSIIGDYSPMGIYNNYELKLYNKIDTLTINNRLFFDILIFEDTISAFYSFKHIYFSRNVGIIKKEEFNGKVWELVNYNVNQ